MLSSGLGIALFRIPGNGLVEQTNGTLIKCADVRLGAAAAAVGRGAKL